MAMMYPTPDCELFLPGHHVHFIQWKLSVATEAPQRVQLVSREGLSMLVRVEDHQELWRFHDDAQDRKALERWERGARGPWTGLPKVANGYLHLAGGLRTGRTAQSGAACSSIPRILRTRSPSRRWNSEGIWELDPGRGA